MKLRLLLSAAALLFTEQPHGGPWPLYAPPPGQILVALAQPPRETPPEGMWPTAPAAFVVYTRLDELDTLAFGAEHLMERYARSALIVGLSLTGALDDVAEGRLDSQINRLLEMTASYRRPVYLRFGFEFDGPWNAYEPQAYKAAWWRLRARLEQRGARHITMVWQASANCGPTYRAQPIAAWYPGDDAVDWVGLSYFRPTECGGVLADGVVAFARQHSKPVFLAEATPRGFDLAGQRYSNDGLVFTQRPAATIWNEWFAPFFAFIDRNQPSVRAVTYINQNWDSYPRYRRDDGEPYPYWGDSRLDTNKEILSNWQAVTSGPVWRWGDERLFDDLGYARQAPTP